MVPFGLCFFVLGVKLWNGNWTHHGIDGDEKEVSFTNAFPCPVCLAHRAGGHLHAGGVVRGEHDLARHFEQITLPGRGDEGQGVDGHGHELPVGEFGACDASRLVHQREQSTAKERVVGVRVLREDFLDEGDGLDGVRLHASPLSLPVKNPRQRASPMTSSESPRLMARCVGLVSGGLDSPVAVARAVRAGWTVHPIHFSMEPVTGPEAEGKVVACLHRLRRLDGQPGEVMQARIVPELHVVPVASVMSKFTEPWCHSEYFIHLKRLFNAIASRHASEVKASALLTGENLGQVSSQTLGNLGAVELAGGLPVLRPLLGLDKSSIVDMARSLGTFDLSTGPEICDVLGPKHPTTVANLEWLERSEDRLGGLQALVDAVWEGHRVVSL